MVVVRIGSAHRGQQPILADGAADFVVVFLVAEVARHATTAAGDDLDFVARSLQHVHRHLVADQRLVMAMAVEQRLAGICSPGRIKLIRLKRMGHKLLEGEGLLGHDPGVVHDRRPGPDTRRAGQDTARFDADNGDALLGIGRQQSDVVIDPGLGLVGLAAGDQRTSAAFALVGEEDLVAGCVQHPHGGLANLGFVVVGPGVVKENDRPLGYCVGSRL